MKHHRNIPERYTFGFSALFSTFKVSSFVGKRKILNKADK